MDVFVYVNTCSYVRMYIVRISHMFICICHCVHYMCVHVCLGGTCMLYLLPFI